MINRTFRPLITAVLLAALPLLTLGSAPGSAASTLALRFPGDYLGTYTPTGGSSSQLQTALDRPNGAGNFEGTGSFRVGAESRECDVVGRRVGRHIRMTVRAVEGNDRLVLKGQWTERSGRITGRILSGRIGGRSVTGRFSLRNVMAPR